MSDDLQKYRSINDLLPDSTCRHLVLLTGAHQTGKTTLARKKYATLRYINLDVPENREHMRQMFQLINDVIS